MTANGPMIGLFLTTKKYLFQKINYFETDIRDHHHLIAMVLKTTCERYAPNEVTDIPRL